MPPTLFLPPGVVLTQGSFPPWGDALRHLMQEPWCLRPNAPNNAWRDTGGPDSLPLAPPQSVSLGCHLPDPDYVRPSGSQHPSNPPVLRGKNFCLLGFSLSRTANKMTKDKQENRQSKRKTGKMNGPSGEERFGRDSVWCFSEIELLPGGAS